MSKGFKPEFFKRLASSEANNFWFQIRNRIIIWAISKYSSTPSTFLEIGCGTGFVTQAIATHFPTTDIIASEFLQEGLVFARQRLKSVSFVQMDARKIPFEDQFCAIGAFDVIEHIEEDEAVLEQIYRALKPKGLVYITVPQHMGLWSIVDEFTCHVRRYSRKELHKKLNQAGFEVVRSTSFVTLLLPLMLTSRFLDRKIALEDYRPDSELVKNPVLNRILQWCMGIDALLIRLGINLPIGGSRLVIARKI